MREYRHFFLPTFLQNIGIFFPLLCFSLHLWVDLFLQIAFMVMCHGIVWNSVLPEKVVRSGAGYSSIIGLWVVLLTIGLKVFCKKNNLVIFDCLFGLAIFSHQSCVTGTLLFQKDIYPRKYSLNLRQLIFFMLLSKDASKSLTKSRNPKRQAIVRQIDEKSGDLARYKARFGDLCPLVCVRAGRT